MQSIVRMNNLPIFNTIYNYIYTESLSIYFFLSGEKLYEIIVLLMLEMELHGVLLFADHKKQFLNAHPLLI